MKSPLTSLYRTQHSPAKECVSSLLVRNHHQELRSSTKNAIAIFIVRLPWNRHQTTQRSSIQNHIAEVESEFNVCENWAKLIWTSSLPSKSKILYIVEEANSTFASVITYLNYIVSINSNKPVIFNIHSKSAAKKFRKCILKHVWLQRAKSMRNEDAEARNESFICKWMNLQSVKDQKRASPKRVVAQSAVIRAIIHGFIT